MSDLHETLPEWVAEELRRPVPTRADRQARVMELVRALPATRRRRRWWRDPSRPGALGAGAALALAASTVLAVLASGPGRGMLPAPVDGARAAVIGDTVVGTLHDTLRLVRFVLHAPSASRV
ncbi:MAG TPA: hypothetical protein VF041_22645, partial [Gemmatimonadaceae bacterium]